ncbi:type II toxin-antitoxin system VapB family antitoxin [Halomonas janggokensis]|uniref:Type II toxin-antitoxin system VapB family antitoxin n=1 Tax=Vreelandella janggokensis TaxID=370767 RepID=A0ABT4IZR5_9GAMM|nr:type II toxin-antitoxin system VapB family antitoxin [Halomonas janggokensis]MCZ0928681.1 type II toxin-antitoxin system VapB family antitoxin [Halomonas janggokensis]MCZ0931416.1 type II toxin-antitoxin system VapB family antitoxin [Halomonas janggokensis]
MKVTITIDDDLYAQALELADPGKDNASDVFRDALQTYVRLKAARRLAELGGEATSMPDVPRRRGEPPKE